MLGRSKPQVDDQRATLLKDAVRQWQQRKSTATTSPDKNETISQARVVQAGPTEIITISGEEVGSSKSKSSRFVPRQQALSVGGAAAVHHSPSSKQLGRIPVVQNVISLTEVGNTAPSPISGSSGGTVVLSKPSTEFQGPKSFDEIMREKRERNHQSTEGVQQTSGTSEQPSKSVQPAAIEQQQSVELNNRTSPQTPKSLSVSEITSKKRPPSSPSQDGKKPLGQTAPNKVRRINNTSIESAAVSSSSSTQDQEQVVEVVDIPAAPSASESVPSIEGMSSSSSTVVTIDEDSNVIPTATTQGMMTGDSPELHPAPSPLSAVTSEGQVLKGSPSIKSSGTPSAQMPPTGEFGLVVSEALGKCSLSHLLGKFEGGDAISATDSDPSPPGGGGPSESSISSVENTLKSVMELMAKSRSTVIQQDMTSEATVRYVNDGAEYLLDGRSKTSGASPQQQVESGSHGVSEMTLETLRRKLFKFQVVLLRKSEAVAVQLLELIGDDCSHDVNSPQGVVPR